MTTILEKIKDSVEQGHYKKTCTRSAHCRGQYGACHAADGGKI